MSPQVRIPDEFAASISGRKAAAGPGGLAGVEWLRALPTLLQETMNRWEVRPAGDPRFGHCALVVPVTGYGPEQGDAVVKLTWPHPESRDEGRTLSLWNGAGAVRLYASDPRRWALLLQQLEPRDLSSVGVIDQAEITGRLAAALSRPAPGWATRWRTGLPALVERLARAIDGSAPVPFPRRLLVHARQIAQDEVRSGPGADVLIHHDLHQGNVLWRPQTQEWVAIDPKPLVAPLALALAPVLWNEWHLVSAATEPRTHLDVRVQVWADAAQVDPDQARRLSLLRLVSTAVDSADSGESGGPDPTVLVTICKAMLPG